MLPSFGWTEILLIAIVLIVVVGPKDLPRVIKGVGKGLRQVRKLSADFQQQMSDALDETELSELRDMARDVKQLDPRHQLKDALNPLSDAGKDIKTAIEGTDEVTVPDSKLAKPMSAVDDALNAAGAKAKAAQPMKAGATAMPEPPDEPKEEEPKTASAKPKETAKKTTTAKAATKKTPAKPKTTTRKTKAAKTTTTRKAAAKPKAHAKPKKGDDA